MCQQPAPAAACRATTAGHLAAYHSRGTLNVGFGMVALTQQHMLKAYMISTLHRL